MNESEILKRVMLAVSKIGCRLHRNNIGVLKDSTGRFVRYGVCNPGGSDALGWYTVTITPDMVGRKLAVFTAIETKTATGKPTPEQLNFIDQVKKAGGIAGIARSEAEAIELFTDF
jgi:hypothetical protein